MIPAATKLLVIAGWIALAALFALRRKPPRRRERRRDTSWKAGVLLQGAAITLVFAFRRLSFSDAGAPFDIALGVTAAALTIASVWFMAAALRALGANFAYQARIVDGHKLVQEGPYRIVRHPMYSGLFGISLATGLAFSRWPVLPVFVALYAAGTLLRIRAEESLLLETFGKEFEEYRRRVPAVIPGLL